MNASDPNSHMDYENARTRAKELLDFGSVALGQGLYRDAESLLRQSIHASEELQDDESKHDRALAYFKLGGVLNRLERAKEAEAAYRHALSILEPLPGTENSRARCLVNLSMPLLDEGHFSDAEDACRNALLLFEISGCDPEDTAPCHLNLALALQQQGQHTQAEEHYSQALANYAAQGELGRDGYAACLANLAGVAHRLGRPAEAEHLYRQALRTRATLGADPKKLAQNTISLADTVLQNGRKGEAEALYRRALEALDSIDGTTRLRNRCNLALADLTNDRDALTEVRRYMWSTLRLSPTMSSPRTVHDLLVTIRALPNRIHPLFEKVAYHLLLAMIDLQTEEMPLDRAHCFQGLSELAHRRGRHRKALEFSSKARELYKGCAQPWLSLIADTHHARVLADVARCAPSEDERKTHLDAAAHLATSTALLIERRRYQFPEEGHRHQWIERYANSSTSRALALAAETGDAATVSDLIATLRMVGTIAGDRTQRTAITDDVAHSAALDMASVDMEAADSIIDGRLTNATGLTADDFAARGTSGSRLRREVGPRLRMPYGARVALEAYDLYADRPTASYT